MKALLLTTCLAVCVPLAFAADPGGNKPPTHSGGRGGPGQGGGPGGVGSRGGWGEMNKEEWDQYREKVMAFIKENSPKRYDAIEKNANERRELRMSMFFKFRGLMMLKDTDPGLYALKVEQIKVEDDEFGLTEQLKDARKDNNTEAIDKIKTQLQQVSSSYVKLRIKERQQRIETLKSIAAREEKELANDQANQEQLVSERVEALMKGETPRSPRRGDSRERGPEPRPANAAP